MKKKLNRILVPVAIVGGGIAVAAALGLAAPQAPVVEASTNVDTVEVFEIVPERLPALLDATGVVVAADEVSLAARVNGQVAWISERLVPGTRVKKGEALLRLDQSDFQLALGQERSRVRQAELEVELERGRNDVAQREWALLAKSPNETAPALALNHPPERRTRAARGAVLMLHVLVTARIYTHRRSGTPDAGWPRSGAIVGNVATGSHPCVQRRTRLAVRCAAVIS